HLFDPNPTVRKAAIGICDIHWNCSSDMGFINACRELAGSDPDQSVRADAIRSLGKALESSRDPSASHFLANVVKDGDKSQEERAAAYWALREIHLGLTEQDNVKRSISLMKLALPRLEMGMTEEEVKQTLLGRGQFAYIDWDSVDLIDWDFVNQFVSSK
ncbi:MAG: HEAT repeat domain-containing protein, partial [Gemmataceae bacterium]